MAVSPASYNITPGDLSAVRKIWHDRVDKAFDEMEEKLMQFNEIYPILNEAEVIILNAKGNSGLASLLELNRFPQKKPCNVYRMNDIPAVEDWIYKEHITVLTVSASGKQEMVNEINDLYKKITQYSEFADRVSNIKSIGITTIPDSPLKNVCAPLIILKGNNKESTTNETFPSTYVGELFEKSVLMDINTLWMIYAYKHKIPESVFKRRHKPRD